MTAFLLATVALAAGWASPALAAPIPGQPAPSAMSLDPVQLAAAASPNVWIKNQYSGACLDVPGWSQSPIQIDQWGCVRQANEYWDFVWVGNYGSAGAYQIVNKHSHLCLNVQGNSHAENAAIIQWHCGDYANEQFQLLNHSGKYQLVPVSSLLYGRAMCLDLDSTSHAWGVKIVQWHCYNTSTQLWTLWSV
ncbi:RICIN domain-containing protein [Dactylosporangium sp. McL0621]|uniref:RICIN domain-containing protein n=1 Tax=Dactylosporangium sp. McL0621 TaxID=3415678 RepID=UPI003CF463DF